MNPNTYDNLQNIQEHESTYKNRWTTGKYAPSILPKNNAGEHQKLKASRQKIFEQNKQIKAKATESVKQEALQRDIRNIKTVSKVKTNSMKKTSRKYYAARHPEMNQCAKNLDHYVGYSLNQRLRIYNRHHKCKHGLKFNKIFKTEKEYVFTCLHETSLKIEDPSTSPCQNCGCKRTRICETEACGCEYVLCMYRCGFSTFKYQGYVKDTAEKYDYYQYYDKHSAHRTTVILDPMWKRGEIKPAHIELKQDVVNEITKDAVMSQISKGNTRKIDRKNFFLSLKEKKPIKFSEVLSQEVKSEEVPTTLIVEEADFPHTIQEEVVKHKHVPRKRINWKNATKMEITTLPKDKIEEIDSVPEGGKESKPAKLDSGKQEDLKSTTKPTTSKDSNSGEVKNVISQMIDKLKYYKNKVISDTIFDKIKNTPFVKEILSFFDTFIYFLRVVAGYIDFTNIILIYDLIRDFQMDLFHSISTGIRLAHLGTVLINNEKNSVMQLDRLVYAINNGDIAAESLFILDFGCLTTAIRYKLLKDKIFTKTVKDGETIYVQGTRSLTHYFQSLDVLGTAGIFSRADIFREPYKGTMPEIEIMEKYERARQKKRDDNNRTEVASNEEFGAFNFLSNLCSYFPKSLGPGVSMFSQFCKTILPILSTVKIGSDLIKMLYGAIDKFIDWWCGKWSNPNEWLTAKKMKEGNPINTLQATFMLYRTKTVHPGTMPQVELSEIREKYYSEKLEAEKYATDSGQYSAVFVQWLKGHSDAMTETPKPTDRPFEPTVICLKGPPGGGKSTVWPLLVARALNLTDVEDPTQAVKETTYTWNSQSEYQTGIVGKRVILFDDFGQDRSTSDEALNLIHLVTSAAYPINSANISGVEIKGMFAVPEVIVVCTNDEDLNSSLLLSREAVERRMDLILRFTSRLEIEKLDERIMRIEQCGRYSEFEGGSLNVFEVAEIFAMLDVYKKYNFSAIKKDINSAIKKLSKLEFQPLRPDMTITKNAQEFKPFSGSYLADLHLFNKVRTMSLIERNDYLRSEKVEISQKKLNPKIKQLKKDDAAVLFGEIVSKTKEVESKAEDGKVLDHFITIMKNSFSTGIYIGSSACIIAGWALAGQSLAEADFSFRSVKNVLIKVFKAMAITIGGCAAIYTFKQFFDKPTEESGGTRTAKAKAKELTSRPEAGENVLIRLAQKATGTLRLSDGMMVNCVFIGGHYILTVNHFFQDYSSTALLPKGTSIQITKSTWNKKVQTFLFDPERVIYFPSHENIVGGKSVRYDVVLYELDNKQFNAEKKIWHHFWNAEYSLINFEVTKVDFMSGMFYATLLNSEDQYIINSGRVVADHVHTKRIKGTDVYWHSAAHATYESRPASCGSIVLAPHTQENSFLGVHIASTAISQASLFHFVTRKEIEEALKNYTVLDIAEQGYAEGHTNLLPENSVLEFVGLVKPAHQNVKTDLTPSTISCLFGPNKTEPSVLSPADSRLRQRKDYDYVRKNFYQLLFAGYNQQPEFMESELREAAEYLKLQNRNIKKTSIVPGRILTMEETMNGIAFLPANTKIEMTTSPGYPFTIHGLKRSDLFFIDNNEVIHASQEIKDEFEFTLQQLREGIVPYTPFTLTIKDERIKKNKIYDDLKPRLFASGNIINLLIMRRYFYTHIMSHYHSSETYTAIKLDRLSLDWHELIQDLLVVGENGFDADFKFFDRSISKTLSYLADEVDLDYVRKNIVSDIGEIGYKTLLEWRTSPYYIFYDKLFRAVGTMPSGDLTTYTKNCTMNELLHISAYLAITATSHPQLSNIAVYKRNCKGRRGGDDTIQTVSETLLPIFNGVTFSNWINKRGMKCTSADKSDLPVPSRPLAQLSFLKNTTGFMRGFYVPLAEKDSIIEMMYWVRLNKHNNDIHQATTDNINAALRCLYFYGPDEYNNVRDNVLKIYPDYKLFSYYENRRIWDAYFYFPGSHSDYASKSDQEGIETVTVERKYSSTPTQTENTIVRMYTELDSTPDVGEDKASRNMNSEHPNVSNQTIITDELNDESAGQSADDIGKTRQEQLGTTVQESEKPIRMVPKTPGIVPTSSSKRAEAHCNDINWTLEFLEEKYTVIRELDWNISNKFNDIIAFLNLPNDVLVTPAMKTPFDTTAYWRANAIKIKVIVKSSPFYSGTLVAGFVPTMTSLTQEQFTSVSDVSQLIQLNGAILQCSDNQEGQVIVPFRHLYGFLEAPLDFLGQFAVFVLNPLRTGPDNSNNVKVVILASIDKSEFKIPEYIPQASYKSLKFREPFSDLDSIPESGRNTQVQIIGQVGINDPIESMKAVMMCAGKGIVSEPEIKHFQDHPIDHVQMKKRFRLIGTDEFPINAGSFELRQFPIALLLKTILGSTASYYRLCRGSLLFKIVPRILPAVKTIVDQNYFKNITFQANIVLPIAGKVQNIRNLEISNGYNGGSHYFSVEEPAEIMVPYLSPLFVSTTAETSDDPYLIQEMALQISVYNFNKFDSVQIQLDIVGCVGDDFAMGVFIGTPSAEAEIGIIESIAESGLAPKTELETQLFEAHKKIYGTLPTQPLIMVCKMRNDVNPAGRALDLQACLEKALKSNYLTKGQERKIVEHLSSKEPSNFTELENKVITEKPHLYKLVLERKFPEIDSTPEAGVIEFLEKAIDTTIPILNVIDDLTNLLDAHPVTYQRYPVTTRRLGYTIATDNVQYIERMLTTNHNGLSLSDKETFGAKKKETGIYDLMTNTRSLYNRFTWDTTQAYGTLLKTIQVGPGIVSPYLYSAPMDVFSPQFFFWNGSIIYIIDIAAALMHRGQLTVTFHPNLTRAPLSLQEATQQYFVTFDLESGRATVAIQVPYLNKKQYLPVPNLQLSRYPVETCYNGIICIWVQNALRASTTVDKTVDVNIYKVAGKDFKLEAYGSNLFMSLQGEKTPSQKTPNKKHF